ncbi:hypothetical protein EC973_003156 [Apophysomyces ossiformis]|uniref:Uncharacterized protein n=1 Tax=Apophysomyces ossiformis TaxID=679940 RepID=A0A8H7EM57_9FUNG|nr:hypothetical protein EC973_003156 [Apophysomyces ossiformis]
MELAVLNQRREQRKLTNIKLDYMYIMLATNLIAHFYRRCLEVTDDQSLDMANTKIFTGSSMYFLSSVKVIFLVDPSIDLDLEMKRAKSFTYIWSKIKSNSLNPTFVKLRVTDEARFMGTMILVDLLNPALPAESNTSNKLYHSFIQLSYVKPQETGTDAY